MSLKDYSHEKLAGMAMIEIANVILEDANKALDFREIYQKLADIKGYTEEQKQEYFAQFYTDLNIDGRFITLGSDQWGLKYWYPVEQIDEQVIGDPKKKKKSKKKQKKKEEKPEKEPAKEPEKEPAKTSEKESDVVEEDIDDLDAGFADGDEEVIDDEELDDKEFTDEDFAQKDEDEENAK